MNSSAWTSGISEVCVRPLLFEWEIALVATVEVQVTLKGNYEFEGGIVIDTCGTARKSAHVGSTPPEVLARIMLREMLEDAGLMTR